MSRTYLALMLACGWLGLSAATASAASVEYCDIYARAYVGHVALNAGKTGGATPSSAELQRVYDTSWAKCLNADEEPRLPPAPTASTAGTTAASADDTTSAAEAAPSGDITASTTAAPPGDEETASAASETTLAEDGGADGPRRGSGLKPWTPEWAAWCKAHYRSFDPKTGTVLPFSGERTLCR